MTPPSVVAEHRYSVNLLKAYGVLSFILVVGDLLSLGATIAQVKVNVKHSKHRAVRCTPCEGTILSINNYESVDVLRSANMGANHFMQSLLIAQ